MATIGDLRQKISLVRGVLCYFGSTMEFDLQFQEYYLSVWEAVAEERQISVYQAKHLGAKSKLGELSGPIFMKMRDWLKIQHYAFLDDCYLKGYRWRRFGLSYFS